MCPDSDLDGFAVNHLEEGVLDDPALAGDLVLNTNGHRSQLMGSSGKHNARAAQAALTACFAALAQAVWLGPLHSLGKVLSSSRTSMEAMLVEASLVACSYGLHPAEAAPE
jgi:hypothetical protein